MSTVLTALAATALLAFAGGIFSPSASAKEVVDYFGTESGTGTLGGEFSRASGIAVNQTGAGPAERGDVYVVDQTNNRIQRFAREDNGTPAIPGDDTYEFISAWGAGVSTGAEEYEVCTDATGCRAALSSDVGGGLATTIIPRPGLTPTLGPRTRVIAVDQDTGNIYVADAANLRVNVYDGAGAFLRSFGYDVVASGPGDVAGPDETQTLTVNADGGKFSLVFRGETTGAESAGRAGDSQPGSTVVTERVGGGLVPPIKGAWDVGQGISVLYQDENIFPPGTVVTEVGEASLTASEPNTNAGPNSPIVTAYGHDLAHNAAAQEVEDALNALSTIGGAGGSVAVTGPAGGPYEIAFGGSLAGIDVPSIGARDANLTLGAGTGSASLAETVKGGAYEVCVAADGDVCRAGTAGAGAGQIGHGPGPSFLTAMGIAISPPDGDPQSGTVFLSDTGNGRVNTYALDGASPTSFGSATQFGTDQLRAIAVDSRGIVYVENIDAGVFARIERYDTQNANGEGVGFIEPIPVGVDERQQVTVAATAGTFRLTFEGETTIDIPYEAPVDTVQEALAALPSIGGNMVLVTGGPGDGAGSSPYVVNFRSGGGTAALSAKDVPELTVSDGSTPLSGGAGASVTTLTQGVPGLIRGQGGDLAVDPDTDSLYAVRSSGVIQQFGPANAPGLTAAPSEDDARHSTIPHLPVQRIALDELDGRIYASASRFGDAFNAQGVYILDTLTEPPSASLDSVDQITATAATAHATIDPNGPPATSYRLEYSTDGSEWDSTKSVKLGIQETPQGVSIPLDPPGGLEPNILYHLRLVVQKPFKPTIVTSELTFTTLGAPPIAETTGAPVRTSTSAQLTGRLSPRNNPTTYHFEYGSQGPCDSNPCESTPTRSAAAGELTQLITEQVEGLEPATTYHYRLLADNGQAGSPVAGQDMKVTTRATDAPLSHGDYPGPPGSDRAWEMISADENNGNPSEFAIISDEGTRSVYQLTGGTPESQVGSLTTQFFAERPPGEHPTRGWETDVDVFPVRSELAGNTWSGELVGPGDLSSFVSLNFNSTPGIIGPAVFRLFPDAPPEKLLQEQVFGGIGGGLTGASEDEGASTVLVNTENPPAPEYSALNGRRLYDIGKGAPELVSILPGEIVPSCPVRGNTVDSLSFAPLRDARYVSADGRLVFFPHQDARCEGPGQLYVRDLLAGETTLLTGPALSGPQCLAAFIKSNADAAFFWTQSRLVAEDSRPGGCADSGSPSDGDVYRYDLAGGQLECLTCLFADFDVDVNLDLDAVSHSANEDIAVANDGSRVYFRSPNRLLAGAGAGVYRLQVGSGELAYLGPLGAVGIGDGATDADLNPDGSVLLFRSKAPWLNPLGEGTDNGDTEQLYRYDDRDRSLVCVSCPQDASAPTDAVKLASSPDRYLNRTQLSEDGDAVFATPTALVAADQNTGAPGEDPLAGTDIYEWRDGRLFLITDGVTDWTPGSEPWLEGITPSGDDVLFIAAAQYTPDALDGYRRVYTAKVGGGIDFPPAGLPPCDLNSGACEGPAAPAPDQTGAGSSVFEGSGNIKESFKRDCRAPAKGARRLSRAARHLALRAKQARRLVRQSSDPRRARAMRRRARRLSMHASRRATLAKRLRAGAKRCRQQNRRASR